MSMEEAERSLEGRYDSAVNLTCELRTLSSMLQELNIDRVHLLKIDVERAELEVLEGIDEADWPAIDQIVAEVHDENGRLAEVTSLLVRQGFEVTVEQDTRDADDRVAHRLRDAWLIGLRAVARERPYDDRHFGVVAHRVPRAAGRPAKEVPEDAVGFPSDRRSTRRPDRSSSAVSPRGVNRQ